MALILNLRGVENIPGKSDRIAKVTFRAHTYTSKTVHTAKQAVYFGESFDWPIGRPIESDEVLFIQIYNHSKYLNNKLLGSFSLVLQQLIQDGEIRFEEPLIDTNNKIMEALISFECRYLSPDGKIGRWEGDEFKYPLMEAGDNLQDLDNQSGDFLETASMKSGVHSIISSLSDDGISHISAMESLLAAKRKDEFMFANKAKQDILDLELHRPRDFQVGVQIVEGQQLAGLNIDPVCRIHVGDDMRHTTIKQSTNCPYWSEYFVFDYHESPMQLFDKMITLTVFDATRLPGRTLLKAGNLVAGKTIGIFRCDLGTVYTAPDHQFYMKWAVLLDPKDIGEGPKGYIKCVLSVIGKGDVVKTPKSDKEENNIEGNLLMPVGMMKERQRAAYRIKIHRADDLPRMDTGIMASVKKAITMNNTAFVDAFIRVSFVGLKGKTSVKKSYYPEWKEQLTFIDMFPPLCNRIKIELMDQDPLSDDVIATHFIELAQIMDPGGDTEGILPTFGPSWINLYGAPRDYKMMEEHVDLNSGVGEGVLEGSPAVMTTLR